jgi:putative hemolysin
MICFAKAASAACVLMCVWGSTAAAQYPMYPPLRPPLSPYYGPPRTTPRASFDVNACLRYCDIGNPEEEYCERIGEGLTRRDRERCWRAANHLWAGDKASCRTTCLAIGEMRYYRAD